MGYAWVTKDASNKGDARPLDKKCLLMTFPPEPLVQIQNYLTELFHIMPVTKILQKGSAPLNKRAARAPDIKYL